MRLTIFSASGGTGRRLLEQALGAGHHVTAVTRHPASIPPRNWLSVVGADVADADAVDATIAGSDAVLSTLGVSYSRKPISVYSQGTRNIIAAMHRHGVKRLVVVSSAPLDPDWFVRKAVGVTTTTGTPSIIGQIWREGITKPKKR